QIQNSLGFLNSRDPRHFCGPVLLGESFTPVGARLRLPALTLKLPPRAPAQAARKVRICGSTAWAWADETRVDILVLTAKKDQEKQGALCHHVFEPLFFYLAVRANPGACAESDMARRWARAARLHVHVSAQEGV